MKYCTVCKLWKPEVEFTANRTKPDGLQHRCKVCDKEYHKTWYENNRTERIKTITERKVKIVNENRKHFVDFLKNNPCCKCGENNILKLQLDHLSDKIKDVTAFLSQGYDWKRIEKEIKKCQVLCASCHMEKTQYEQNSWRLEFI